MQTITITDGRADQPLHLTQFDAETVRLVLNDAVAPADNTFRAFLRHVDGFELTIPYAIAVNQSGNDFHLDFSGINTSVSGHAYLQIQEIDEESGLLVMTHPFEKRLPVIIKPMLFATNPHPFRRNRRWVAVLSKNAGEDATIDSVKTNDGFPDPVVSRVGGDEITQITFPTGTFAPDAAIVRANTYALLPAGTGQFKASPDVQTSDQLSLVVYTNAQTPVTSFSGVTIDLEVFASQ